MTMSGVASLPPNGSASCAALTPEAKEHAELLARLNPGDFGGGVVPAPDLEIPRVTPLSDRH
jgi:hypothetical protein